MKKAKASNRIDNRWPEPPSYALPSIILVLFLALSFLAFLRSGDSLRDRFEETYLSASRILVSHVKSQHPAEDINIADLQRDFDAISTYDDKITRLEFLLPGTDGSLEVVTANRLANPGRPASEIENEACRTRELATRWTRSSVDFTLDIAVPLLGQNKDVIGCFSWSIAAAPTSRDAESMLFGVGFVLLLFVIALYYFSQFRRMKEHYAEKDRTAVELRRLSVAVDQSANMIVITDINGVIEYVNPRFTELTGYTPEEAVGRPSNILKSGTHPPEFYDDLWKTIASQHTWTGLVYNRRKNDELYWERKTISPVIDDRGEIQNYLSVGEDITSELRSQQRIIEKDKMSAIGMLAAGVAHEFKNYLGGIMGNASLALEDIDKPEGLRIAREALELVIDLSEKANLVAMSLLTYSRSRPEVVGAEDLRKIIEQSLSLVSKEMASRAIQVATYFEEIPRLNVSSSKIQQLLLNLLINAAHAIGEDGVITIALFNAGDAVKIVVGDSGSGIAPDQISRIFDPFYSSKGVWGKDDVVGTGMGLPICRNIVREYHGELTVESVPGIGTAFTVVLPVEGKTGRETTAGAPTTRSLRFLIFTMDKSIVSRLHAEASAAGIKLMIVDNITAVPSELRAAADLFICDARFPAKGELQHIVDACEASGFPFVTIFSEQLEYPIADIQERSLKSFANLPSVNEILEVLGWRSDEAKETACRQSANSGRVSPLA